MYIRIPFHLKHLRCAEVLKGALEVQKENAKSKRAGDIKRKFALGFWMYFKPTDGGWRGSPDCCCSWWLLLCQEVTSSRDVGGDRVDGDGDTVDGDGDKIDCGGDNDDGGGVNDDDRGDNVDGGGDRVALQEGRHPGARADWGRISQQLEGGR